MACAAAGPPADDLLTPDSVPVDSDSADPVDSAEPADPVEPLACEDAEAAAPPSPPPPQLPEDAEVDPSSPAGATAASPSDPREDTSASQEEDAAPAGPASSASRPPSPATPEPSSSPQPAPLDDASIPSKTIEKCDEVLIIENCDESSVQVILEEKNDRPVDLEEDVVIQKDNVKNDENIIREIPAREEVVSEKKKEIIVIDKPEQNNHSSANINEFASRDENARLKDEGCLSGESENESNHVVVSEEKNKHNAVKRGLSDNTTEHCPSKKLCQELQDTFPKHDVLLTDYLSNISCSNEEEINKHTDNLVAEIEMLRELATAKEMEWNQLIHLRKVKEEILLRLLRKRNMVSAEKVFCNLTDLNKDLLNKQMFELNKTCVEDKNDEVRRIKSKNVSSTSGNAVQLNSSGLMMVPVSSSVYCQSNMNNSNYDGHLNPHLYNNKPNILPKPMMMPNHRMPGFHIPEMNGQPNRYSSQKGRQGAVKDVQSIIADHRQRYPDTVPRRGRRMKSVLNPQMPNVRMPIPHSDHNAADLGLLFGNLDNNQHLSPVDAMSIQQNSVLNQAGGLPNGMSFKDVLVRFANITGQQQTNCMNAKLHPPPPYPDVTLHPVGGNAGSSSFPTKISQQQQQQQTNSLLHGILTKSQPRQENRFSTFSPTLAQLLTAPEKNTPGNVGRSANSINTVNNYVQQKTSSEITITAVQPTTSNNTINQNQSEVLQLDEFEETEPEEDSADRPLVIDEGGRENSTNNKELANSSLELNENEVPECQGCRKREAQFVCAGCANQWYCSRECQVSAWDDHSEVCTG